MKKNNIYAKEFENWTRNWECYVTLFSESIFFTWHHICQGICKLTICNKIKMVLVYNTIYIYIRMVLTSDKHTVDVQIGPCFRFSRTRNNHLSCILHKSELQLYEILANLNSLNFVPMKFSLIKTQRDDIEK